MCHYFMYCVVCGVNICAFLCHMETARGLGEREALTHTLHTTHRHRDRPQYVTYVYVYATTHETHATRKHIRAHIPNFRSAKRGRGERKKALKRV